MFYHILLKVLQRIKNYVKINILIYSIIFNSLFFSKNIKKINIKNNMEGEIACMNLNNLDIRAFGKELFQNEKLANFANEFIKELGNYLENKIEKEERNMKMENKYSNYWKYQNFMEDNVSARNRTFKIWK